MWTFTPFVVFASGMVLAGLAFVVMPAKIAAICNRPYPEKKHLSPHFIFAFGVILIALPIAAAIGYDIAMSVP